MYGGIDQLVDTYKGNPQPLQSKVQKAQQSQPPGEVPPDLEEALALQEIAELRQGAQNQQAMQAGGAQQSVVDKLKQMLGGMRQQAQMAQAPQQPSQGQPVMAARGGSIDQLMSNLGRYYAGGGIIAFNGKDGSDVPTEAELEAQRKADREKIDALAKALGQTGGEYAGKSMAALADIASLIPRGLAGAVDTAMIRPARALGAKVDYLSPALTPGNQSSDTMTPFYDRYIRAKESANKTPSEAPTMQSSYPGTKYEKPGNIASPTVNNMYTDKDGKTFVRPAGMSDESWKKLVATARTEQTPTSQGPSDRIVPRYPITASKPPVANAPAAPRPPTANVNAPAAPAAPAKPATEPESPLEAALNKSIMEALAKDPEAIRKKAMEQNAQFMGLDALLKPAQDRAASREAMIKEIQANRMPAWVEALSAAGKPVRGGLGTLLGQMGNQAQATRAGYQTEDLKFLDELNKLNSEIDKARIEGRYKDVAAGQAAVKDLIAEQRQAEQSGTSLLNTKAINKSREQTALDNRLSREAIAAQSAQTRRDAQKERANFQLEKLKQGERALDIKIAQAGITAQRPAIDAAAKEAKMHRMIYEALKDRDPEKAEASLTKADEAQHRINMILAPLSGIAGSSPAAAATGKPAPSTGGAKFLGFEPSKS